MRAALRVGAEDAAVEKQRSEEGGRTGDGGGESGEGRGSSGEGRGGVRLRVGRTRRFGGGSDGTE